MTPSVYAKIVFRVKCESDAMITRDEAVLIIALFAASFKDVTIDMVAF
jgi:hypothetical protein